MYGELEGTLTLDNLRNQSINRSLYAHKVDFNKLCFQKQKQPFSLTIHRPGFLVCKLLNSFFVQNFVESERPNIFFCNEIGNLLEVRKYLSTKKIDLQTAYRKSNNRRSEIWMSNYQTTECWTLNFQKSKYWTSNLQLTEYWASNLQMT